MNLDLAGQTALVIGGASGIGYAIADAFVREGASAVILWDVSTATTAAADKLSQPGCRMGGTIIDVTDYSAVTKYAAELRDSLGNLDHLVYAAGVGSGKYGFPFWNLEPADWDRVWRVNLLGAVNAAHAFAPKMAARRRGTLLFISSVAGQIGSQTDPPYSAAKAALINFAQCAAKDLAPFDVRVNTICPGMIQTPLNRSVWQAWHDREPLKSRKPYEAWAAEKIARVAPLGRWQTPEDVASLAVFLASPRAKNITGQTLNVDGGQVMHS